MSHLDTDIQLLIELYADGEIDPADRPRVEQALASDPAAQEYLAVVEELRQAVRLPVEAALENVSFDGLFDRVMKDAAPAATPTVLRVPELELLAMTRADGETLSDIDQDRVSAYLHATPDAADAVVGLGELRDAFVLPVEQAAERVDFEALARRIDSALDSIDAERSTTHSMTPAERRTLWTAVSAFVSDHRAVFASALTAAAVVALMLPMIQRPTATPAADTEVATPAPTVINNYYVTSPVVDSVEFEPGYWSGVTPGDADADIAPVIWIAPESKDDGDGASAEPIPTGTPL